MIPFLVDTSFTDKYVAESGIEVRNISNKSLTLTNTNRLSLGITFQEAKDLYDILGTIIAKEK
jgi:hypothetical protein